MMMAPVVRHGHPHVALPMRGKRHPYHDHSECAHYPARQPQAPGIRYSHGEPRSPKRHFYRIKIVSCYVGGLSTSKWYCSRLVLLLFKTATSFHRPWSFNCLAKRGAKHSDVRPNPEPDGSRRAFSDSAFNIQPENQAA